MSLPEVIASAYRLLSRHRILLCIAVAAMIGASLLGVRNIHMAENIAAMLPETGSVAEDFHLLQQAPFARKVVISVEREEGVSSERLIESVDLLAKSLDPHLFTEILTGPDEKMQQRMMPWLLKSFPAMLTPEDLQSAVGGLDAAEVRSRLQESYQRLLGPEGWVLKRLIQSDPLQFHSLALKKFRYLNLVPGAHITRNHFLNPDRRSALLFAETPVEMTDSAGSERLLQSFQTASERLPAGISATLVSGHRYTLANARAIQTDLWRILTVSTLALIALFLVFLRSIRAVFVFLIPLSVVAVAAIAVGFFYPEVSAVTIGFGAVLMGISVDFGLHVYFALRSGRGSTEEILGRIARPVVFGALTSMTAFGVLLVSDLPGQRQLAVFSIAGLGVALLLALLVLPHLLVSGREEKFRRRVFLPSMARNRWILAAWILFLILAGWQATGITFNGDMRSISLVPEELAQQETRLREQWGQVRGRAMVWAFGGDEDSALAVNAQVFERLRERFGPGEMVSLAPLLPSVDNQEVNLKVWRDFWAEKGGQKILADLERAGADLKFTEEAFAPFRHLVSEGGTAPVTSQAFETAGLGTMVHSLLVPMEDGRVGVLTLIPESDENLKMATAALNTLEDVRIVSPGQFRQEISQAIGHDFRRFLLLAAVAVILMLVLLFRHPEKVLLALVPVVSGLLCMLGGMGWFGIDFNLFNVIAAILVVGLGVDYGIFMIVRHVEKLEDGTERAVLVSGLTTLAGFGALVLARHPALQSIGITVILGLGGAIPAALMVVPALLGEGKK